MKYILAVAVVLAAALLFPALPTHSQSAPPIGAVRIVSLEDGTRYCSAVVIEPGVAMTAAHCLQRYMKIDGVPAVRANMSLETKDAAVVYAPGLACPCAPIGTRPSKGDQVLAVGFPGLVEGGQVVSPVARVEYVGDLKEFLPDWPADALTDDEYIITKPIIRPGDSGGALFSMQNGRWRLVGINAIGIPDLSTCQPFTGCATWLYTGFIPIDVAEAFL